MLKKFLQLVSTFMYKITQNLITIKHYKISFILIFFFN